MIEVIKYAIYNSEEKMYLVCNDEYTEDISEALLFDTYGEALDYKDKMDENHLCYVEAVQVTYNTRNIMR